MAAPMVVMQTAMLRRIQGRLPALLWPSVASRSITLSAPREGKKERAVKGLQKSERFLQRRVSGSHHKKDQWFSNPMGIAASPVSVGSSSRKGPSQGLQRRAHQLSVMLAHYVTSLIYNGEIDQRLVDLNVEIVRVKMATDLSALHVYWMGSGSKQDDVIQEILKDAAFKMRRELAGLHLLGSVPPVVFIKDITQARLQQVQMLLETADMGPEHEKVDIGDEIRSDITLPRPEVVGFQEEMNRVSQVFANHDLSLAVESVSHSHVRNRSIPQEPKEHLESLSDIDVTLRSDVYNLDHSSLAKKIADHRRNIIERPFENNVNVKEFIENKTNFSKEELRKLLNKRMVTQRRPRSDRVLQSQVHNIEDNNSVDRDDEFDDNYVEDEYEEPDYRE